MRILLQGRRNSSELRGGDSTVHERLARELRALGHDVEISSGQTEDCRSFDVVHGINLDRSVLAETENLAEAAAWAGKRFFLTPLWWPLDLLEMQMTPAARLTFKAKGLPPLRALHDRRLRSLRSLHKRQSDLLRSATLVTVSGLAEKIELQREFGPLSATDEPLLGTDAAPEIDQTHPRSGVLCVGRLDPRKNQLSLIEALDGSGLSLTLIGTDRIFPAYVRACRDAAGPDVIFTGYVPADELRRAYLSARVHALPSIFELPGLTSLDAAGSGAAVVASRAGTAVDYLGSDAWYCEPDVASIRRAVLAAYERGAPPGLSARISGTYSWRRSAELYLEAYRAK